MERIRCRLGFILAVAGFAGAPAAAHDLWIMPGTFRPVPGASVEVELRVGEKFPVSMNAPRIDGVTRLALVSMAGETPIEGARPRSKVVAARFVAPPAGTAVIVLEGKPRTIVLPPEKFEEYLLHEGLSHIHEERARRGEAGKDGRESYSRHSKALIRVTAGDGMATRPVGLRLELVPSVDPDDVPPGQALPVTALFDGKPLAGLELRFYTRGGPAQRVTTAADGTASLAPDRPGPWCVAFIHMERCEGCPDADWRSYFGTVTFEVPARK